MNPADFEHFAALIRARSGLFLGPDKAYLLNSRLAPIARAEGQADVPALLSAIRKEGSERLIAACADALATHESSFFRDGAPFEVLKTQILPQMLAARREARTLRIWCTACSSGQEPYSIAMILQELASLTAGFQIEILGTDFSRPILDKARSGFYSDFEVRRGLSPERLNRWFVQEDGGWRISPMLRQRVEYRPHNLLSGTFGMGTFDLIFCRNVLIYFDVERKKRVLDDLIRVLSPEGALLLGSAETILGLTDALEPWPGARGVYRQTAGALAATA